MSHTNYRLSQPYPPTIRATRGQSTSVSFQILDPEKRFHTAYKLQGETNVLKKRNNCELGKLSNAAFHATPFAFPALHENYAVQSESA